MKGDLYINGYDAYDKWGINFEDGAFATLIAPPPMKDFVQNASRLQHGVRITAKAPRYDSRDVTLPFHIIARSTSAMLDQFTLFCQQVLATGKMEICTRHNPDTLYHLWYVSCSQFSNVGGLAKFTLKATEPDPTNRDFHDGGKAAWIIETT